MPRKPKRSGDEKTSKFFVTMKARRQALGLKQLDVAKRIGVDRSRISVWESGTFMESPERLEQLARALETSPDYLFGFREEP